MVLSVFLLRNGETFLGEKYKFASWTLHMAFIIIFSSLWGLCFKEWKGVSKKTMRTLLGMAVIIFSTLLIGVGNSM